MAPHFSEVIGRLLVLILICCVRVGWRNVILKRDEMNGGTRLQDIIYLKILQLESYTTIIKHSERLATLETCD